ncbi:hypothetical protein VNO78_21034 [Psophocarpus tetragonolobus]|uniref:Uncharacterized protein n=1 Tax=Psophocarpus tetragonolobus TaxID=3891 RepID=A0AAN9SB14_PSOTE
MIARVLVPCFFMDLYINGVNQVFDLEIDKTFVLKRPLFLPRSLMVSIVFMSLYSIGISLSKDIPDVEGDKKFGIYSFTARLGQKQVFWMCVFFFEMAFGVALLAGASSSASLWIKIVTGLGHATLASILCCCMQRTSSWLSIDKDVTKG